MTYTEPGVWAVYDYEPDPHLIAVYDEEICALRKAVDLHGAAVVFLPFGISLREAIDD
jgi:hypothetical protein